VTEADRKARNAQRLTECDPVFRLQLEGILAGLEAQGFRPRIQTAWRSLADQRAAATAGHSQLSWGFHNATQPDGTPDSLAADVLDDDHPLNPSRPYVMALAKLALVHGCQTGILWGLPLALRRALGVAIAGGITDWHGKIGWDPSHVEHVGISIADAKAGIRPMAPGTPPPNANA